MNPSSTTPPASPKLSFLRQDSKGNTVFNPVNDSKVNTENKSASDDVGRLDVSKPTKSDVNEQPPLPLFSASEDMVMSDKSEGNRLLTLDDDKEESLKKLNSSEIKETENSRGIIIEDVSIKMVSNDEEKHDGDSLQNLEDAQSRASRTSNISAHDESTPLNQLLSGGVSNSSYGAIKLDNPDEQKEHAEISINGLNENNVQEPLLLNDRIEHLDEQGEDAEIPINVFNENNVQEPLLLNDRIEQNVNQNNNPRLNYRVILGGAVIVSSAAVIGGMVTYYFISKPTCANNGEYLLTSMKDYLNQLVSFVDNCNSNLTCSVPQVPSAIQSYLPSNWTGTTSIIRDSFSHITELEAENSMLSGIVQNLNYTVNEQKMEITNLTIMYDNIIAELTNLNSLVVGSASWLNDLSSGLINYVNNASSSFPNVTTAAVNLFSDSAVKANAAIKQVADIARSVMANDVIKNATNAIKRYA